MQVSKSLQILVLLLTTLSYCLLVHSQVQGPPSCYELCQIASADPDQSDATCVQLNFTVNCYIDNFEQCRTEFNVELVIHTIFLANDKCAPAAITCPSVPVFSFDDSPAEDLDQADITPEPHSCAMEPQNSMKQCSMFTYSHIRTFEGYRTGLETCTVPGAWYLLKNRDISVVVESTAVAGSDHTQLSKVSVTFSASKCSGEAKSYVATLDAPLPYTLTDNLPINNSNSPLQIKSTINGTVVTLLAVWINSTVIVRKFGGFLSVTVQLPGSLAFPSDGLCLGCPPNIYHNFSSFVEKVQTNCITENDDTQFNCFVHSGLVHDDFSHIDNRSYSDVCIFDVYKAQNRDIYSMLRAVGQDARLLPNKGDAAVRIIDEPPILRPPDTTTPSPLTIPTTVSRTETPPTVMTTQSIPTTEPAEGTTPELPIVSINEGLLSSTSSLVNIVTLLVVANLVAACLSR